MLRGNRWEDVSININELIAKINAIGGSALWTYGVGEDLRNSDNYIIQVSFLLVNASLRVNDPVARATALSTIQSRSSSPSYLHVKYMKVIVKNASHLSLMLRLLSRKSNHTNDYRVDVMYPDSMETLI